VVVLADISMVQVVTLLVVLVVVVRVEKQVPVLLLEQRTLVVVVVVQELLLLLAVQVAQVSLSSVIQQVWQSQERVERLQQSAHTVFTHSLQLVHFHS
jgi:hypothetical protein